MTGTYVALTAEQSRTQWIAWLEGYGIGKFYDVFLDNAQGAKSTCVNCGETITLDIVEGGGVTDWAHNGDYGCGDSPDTSEDGTGSHVARGTAGIR